MPLLVRIIAHFTGHAKTLPGPYTLGKYSLPLNFIGLTFLIFTSITFNFPTLNPVTKDNMNYTSAAIGVVGLVSVVTWVTTGRKNFTGPLIGGENTRVVDAQAEEGSGTGSDGGGAGMVEKLKAEI